MNKKELTILITNYNTTDFIELLLYSLLKMTKRPFNIIVNDNGSSAKEIEKLLNLAKEYNNVYLHFRESKGERASLAHGKALDIIMEQANTKYTAVFDSDTVILRKNWDELLINRLNDKIKIVGSPLPEISSGEKPCDFPFQFIVLFASEIFKKLNISWQPKDSLGDTGWELKPKYINAGYGGEILIAKNTREYKEGLFNEVICVEYYLKGDNQIFASHFGRGHGLGGHKYRRGTPFIYRLPKIGGILRKKRGRKEKTKWIKMAKKVIDKQL